MNIELEVLAAMKEIKEEFAPAEKEKLCKIMRHNQEKENNK